MTNNVGGTKAIFIVCGAVGMSPALKITHAKAQRTPRKNGV
jgi:hypothetical protein